MIVKSFVDCIHCYLKQAVSCMVMAGINDEKKIEVLYTLMDYIKTFDINDSPAYNSTLILHRAYQIIENPDPYKNVKYESNNLALSLYNKLKSIVFESNDPLYMALKIAVAGNVIDLGIKRNFDIHNELENALNTGFSHDDYELFRSKLSLTNNVVIIGDNAGEIVFDKILVEVLNNLDKKVTYIIKSKPILNDSTMDDVKYVGMDKIASIVETGTNFLGFPIDQVSYSAKKILFDSSLTISKGQANLESLDDCQPIKDSIFFLLKIKCEHLAEYLNFKMGDLVFVNGNNLKA